MRASRGLARSASGGIGGATGGRGRKRGGGGGPAGSGGGGIGGPSRGARRRCERAVGSLEARVGGLGGHLGARAADASEPWARSKREWGDWGAISGRAPQMRASRGLARSASGGIGGPSRGARRRCERAVGSLEARVGGWGGHLGARAADASEPWARSKREWGDWGAISGRAPQMRASRGLARSASGGIG